MKTGDINIEQVEQNKNKNSSLITMVDALINVMNMNTSNTEQTSEVIIKLAKHALNQGKCYRRFPLVGWPEPISIG